MEVDMEVFLYILGVIPLVISLCMLIQTIHLMFYTIPKMQKDIGCIVQILEAEKKKRDLERIEAKRRCVKIG